MMKAGKSSLAVATVAFACGLAAFAMPTKEELVQAQKLVEDLTADDVRALNAGTKKPGEVAAAQLAMADEAETEDGKYLLLQGAFKLYARSADYDAAADALARMRKEIADLPPEVVVELVNSEMRRVAAEKAPKVLALFRDAQRTIKCRKELEAAESAAKARPGNAAAQRRLAECHAGLGDWPKALEIFAKAGDEAAKYELDPSSAKGYDLLKAANYWWEYQAKDDEPFKVHAAVLYRTGLADGSISGLRKTLAEKRVKQMESAIPAEGDGAAANVSAAPRGGGAPTASASEKTSEVAAPAVSASNGKEISFKLATGVTMDFVPCPAGSFEMGCDDFDQSPQFKHKVTITRPFWIGKYQVTRAAWNLYHTNESSRHRTGEGETMLDECGGLKAAKSLYPSYNEVVGFTDWLSKYRKSVLPKGYVIRLPTEAEWEYALYANGGKPGNPYIKWRDGDESVRSQIMVTWADYEKILGARASKIGKWGAIPSLTVGTKLPNDWGIYDMLGNGREFVLDTLDDTGWTHAKRQHAPILVGSLLYEKSETDPVRICVDAKKACAIMRGTSDTDYRAFAGSWFGKSKIKLSQKPGLPLTFRLVIGPDLLKERGIK